MVVMFPQKISSDVSEKRMTKYYIPFACDDAFMISKSIKSIIFLRITPTTQT